MCDSPVTHLVTGVLCAAPPMYRTVIYWSPELLNDDGTAYDYRYQRRYKYKYTL